MGGRDVGWEGGMCVSVGWDGRGMCEWSGER